MLDSMSTEGKGASDAKMVRKCREAQSAVRGELEGRVASVQNR